MTASVGRAEIQTDMKHALLWELHATTVENQTTMPKCASESHKSWQAKAKETKTTAREAADLAENVKIQENPNVEFMMHVMTGKDLKTPTRRTKHIEYQDQSSDYSSTNESDDSSTNSDDECYMQYLKTHHTSQNKTSQEKTSTVKIDGNDKQVEPQTPILWMSTSSRNCKRKHRM